MESTHDDSENTTSLSDALEYYHKALGYDVAQSTRNLDDPLDARNSIDTIQSTTTSNFLLDFSDDAALASFNLHTSTVARLLDAERPEVLNTRWINIWFPAHQKPLLEVLARRYDFSPRLLALMSSEPLQERQSQSTVRDSSSVPRRRRQRGAPLPDLEAGYDKVLDELSELSSTSSRGSVTGVNLYQIIDDLWHYSSIDLGRNYICLGYNSLYGTKHSSETPGEGPLPHCTRAWSWLLICEDNTIISIQEDPFPFAQGELGSLQSRILSETRRNLVSVFRSLCATETSSPATTYPMIQFPLRSRLGTTPSETAHRPTDTPGLLFYYLFENWQNSYTLITRRESRYGIELASLRTEMFQSPRLVHIDRLDSIGKELGVLKRHYASYTRIIDRLIEQQSTIAASLPRIVSRASQTSLDTIRPTVARKDRMLGVSLRSAALVRFKRLRDLIDLYALNEVEEYIKQKESLVAMNFSLIAIKESLDVERLTRLTLLLTKVTMIFLPVSLMTAYFSVPLSGVDYGVKEFWVSFAVVFFLSSMALFMVGVLTGTVQVLTVWQGIWRRLKSLGSRLVDQLWS